jgi:hypothetical protein
MPRVIVTTANDMGKPRIGGPILMDEEVDLIQMDSAHHVPQFLERMATALEGADRAEARLARLRKQAQSTEAYLKAQAGW